jgi:hypothetical protein
MGNRAKQTEIVVVDLVPIAERGNYLGILAAVWALTSSVGPTIGGALASAGQWRWLFYRWSSLPSYLPFSSPFSPSSAEFTFVQPA